MIRGPDRVLDYRMSATTRLRSITGNTEGFSTGAGFRFLAGNAIAALRSRVPFAAISAAMFLRSFWKSMTDTRELESQSIRVVAIGEQANVGFVPIVREVDSLKAVAGYSFYMHSSPPPL
jgi:hypothetical protein